jgi:hypothetical protein
MAEYRQAISNSNLSALLNAIIFVRACEDYVGLSNNGNAGTLLALLPTPTDQSLDLAALLQDRLNQLSFEVDLEKMFPADRFAPFREFDWGTTYEMLRDFYKPSASPYEFNFAFMSKHALSRIYERF